MSGNKRFMNFEEKDHYINDLREMDLWELLDCRSEIAAENTSVGMQKLNLIGQEIAARIHLAREAGPPEGFFAGKLKAAGEYQFAQIMVALTRAEIDLPVEDIQDRIVLAMHSFSITEKIIEQIKKVPKEMAKMSTEEKLAAAKWERPEGAQGTREQSRKIIEQLITPSSVGLKEKIEAAQEASSKNPPKGKGKEDVR